MGISLERWFVLSPDSHFLLCSSSPLSFGINIPRTLVLFRLLEVAEGRTAISFILYCDTIYNFTLVTEPLSGLFIMLVVPLTALVCEQLKLGWVPADS